MAGKRRILMTADAVGGVWTFAVELRRALRAHDVEVLVAVLGPEPSPAQRMQLDAQLACHEGRLEWMDEPWRDVDAMGEWLLELAAEFRPGVVHLNGYAHAALPWAAPVIVTAHSCVLSWWRAVHGEAAPPRFAPYRQRVSDGLAAADLVIAPTEAMKAALQEEHEFSGRVAVVPNGCAHDAFRPRKKRQVIFASGRGWDEAKNIRLLNDIAPELSCPIEFAGAGASFDALQALGFLDRLSLSEALGSAQIYAAPAFYEPFGLAILEAGLSGCALVLADIPSLRENWEGAALFAAPNDTRAWIETLERLAKNPEDWAQKARLRAAQFTLERMAAGYLRSYESLLQEEIMAA